MREFQSSVAKTLANWLSDIHRNGASPPVLFLGAGCSVSAGCPTTPELLRRVGDCIGKKIDGLEGLADVELDAMLALLKYELEPGIRPRAYEILADLIEMEYFDLVLTTNWDLLFEGCLRQRLGPAEFGSYVRPYVSDDTLAGVVRGDKPRVKLLKLHGDLLTEPAMRAEELLKLDDPLNNALRELVLARGIVLLGYGLEEPRIIKFVEPPASIWSVNPVALHKTESLAKAMHLTKENTISGDDALFDRFVEGLCWELRHKHHRRHWGLRLGARDLRLLAKPQPAKLQARTETDHNRLQRQLQSTTVSDSAVDTEIRRLLENLERCFRTDIGEGKELCLIFVHDPAAPGGREIRERIESQPRLKGLCHGMVFATIDVEGRPGIAPGPRTVSDREKLPKDLADYAALVLVDSVSFSGATLEAARSFISNENPDLGETQFVALLILINPDTLESLEKAGWEVIYNHKYEQYHVTFPWGCTRATRRLASPVRRPKGETVEASFFRYLPKPWGDVCAYRENECTTCRLLTLFQGQRTSWHYHLLRTETFVVLDESVCFRFWTEYLELRKNQSIRVPPGVPHQLIALDERCRVLEMAEGYYDQKSDIVRLEDSYHRKPSDDGEI